MLGKVKGKRKQLPWLPNGGVWQCFVSFRSVRFSGAVSYFESMDTSDSVVDGVCGHLFITTIGSLFSFLQSLTKRINKKSKCLAFIASLYYQRFFGFWILLSKKLDRQEFLDTSYAKRFNFMFMTKILPFHRNLKPGAVFLPSETKVTSILLPSIMQFFSGRVPHPRKTTELLYTCVI